MEIRTAPRPPAPTPWGRLVLSVALLGPVSVLVLLPVGLGLERYVMTGDSMGGALGRGSVAFERVVPLSDLRVGDVITYPRPDQADDAGMVTHRVVSLDAEGIVTRGDAEPEVDPWVLRPESPTVSRVEFAVPWVGWPYLVVFRPWGWAAVVVGAALLLLGLTRRRPQSAERAAAPGPAEPFQPAAVLATREPNRE